MYEFLIMLNVVMCLCSSSIHVRLSHHFIRLLFLSDLFINRRCIEWNNSNRSTCCTQIQRKPSLRMHQFSWLGIALRIVVIGIPNEIINWSAFVLFPFFCIQMNQIKSNCNQTRPTNQLTSQYIKYNSIILYVLVK